MSNPINYRLPKKLKVRVIETVNDSAKKGDIVNVVSLTIVGALTYFVLEEDELGAWSPLRFEPVEET